MPIADANTIPTAAGRERLGRGDVERQPTLRLCEHEAERSQDQRPGPYRPPESPRPADQQRQCGSAEEHVAEEPGTERAGLESHDGTEVERTAARRGGQHRPPIVLEEACAPRKVEHERNRGAAEPDDEQPCRAAEAAAEHAADHQGDCQRGREQQRGTLMESLRVR